MASKFENDDDVFILGNNVYCQKEITGDYIYLIKNGDFSLWYNK